MKKRSVPDILPKAPGPGPIASGFKSPELPTAPAANRHLRPWRQFLIFPKGFGRALRIWPSRFCRPLAWLTCLLCLGLLCHGTLDKALTGTACAAENAQGHVPGGFPREIFGTPKAAELVAQAQTHDPLYCPREQADRNQAVQLYEQAIAAQPGAKINARLADRVAQLYGFYADREKGVTPDRDKAGQWWRRCIELTEPNQFLWAQAQMGLASMAVISHDPTAALACYHKILEMDVNQVGLPNWSVWPDSGPEPSPALSEQERAHLRASLERLQGRAVEKLFYVLCRTSRIGALGALQSLAARYRGTPVGTRAATLIAEIEKVAGPDPLGLLEGPLAMGAEQQPPLPPPPCEPPQEIAAQTAAPPTMAEAPGGRRGWGAAIGAGVAAVLAGAGIVWCRHPRQA